MILDQITSPYPSAFNQVTGSSQADFSEQYADLLQSLYDLAIAAGAVVQFGTSVEELDPLQPSVRLSTGEVLRPDIVIGADGYQSLVQRTIERDILKKSIDEADEREPYRREDSGTVIYSLNVDISDITPESDPELYEIVHQNEWTAYMGPYISILTSPSVWYSTVWNVRNATKSIHFLR